MLLDIPVRFKNKEGINQVKAKKTFSSLQDQQKIFTENVSSIVRDRLIFKNLFLELLPEPITFLLTFEKTQCLFF